MGRGFELELPRFGKWFLAVFLIKEMKMAKLVMPIVVGLMVWSWISFFSVVLA